MGWCGLGLNQRPHHHERPLWVGSRLFKGLIQCPLSLESRRSDGYVNASVAHCLSENKKRVLKKNAYIWDLPTP